ncbi:hypothetical protein ACRBEV_04350 [Methylobacterium phyllosphaerae]
MSADLIAPAAQVCAFALGCALIHAARAQAAAITHLLIAAAVIAAALVLIEAAIVFAPNPEDRLDELSVHAALALQPAGLEVESGQRP